MQTWTHIDKKTWPEGPWNTEPDKAQWVDNKTGLDCLIVRHTERGHLCGYVGVPEGHKCFGKAWGDPEIMDLEVHGGITFGSECAENSADGHGICHIPEPGRPETVWWLGFDMAHGGDYSPGVGSLIPYFPRFAGEELDYKDVRFVTHQCERLAAQLKEMT